MQKYINSVEVKASVRSPTVIAETPVRSSELWRWWMMVAVGGD